MGRQIPRFIDRVVRVLLGYTRESIDLFKGAVVSAAPAIIFSRIIRPLFNPFVLYLDIDSTGTDDHYVTLVWEYWDERSGQWYEYNQGFWVGLTFEDVDTASGLHRCYTCDFSGKTMRLKATCTGGSSVLYFTISAQADLIMAEAAE